MGFIFLNRKKNYPIAGFYFLIWETHFPILSFIFMAGKNIPLIVGCTVFSWLQELFSHTVLGFIFLDEEDCQRFFSWEELISQVGSDKFHVQFSQNGNYFSQIAK